MKRLLSTTCLVMLLVPIAGLSGQESSQQESEAYKKAARHYHQLAELEKAKQLKELAAMKELMQDEYSQLLELKKKFGEKHPSVLAKLAVLRDKEAALVDATGVIDVMLVEKDRMASVRHRIQRLADLMNQLSVEITDIRDESAALAKQQPKALNKQ